MILKFEAVAAYIQKISKIQKDISVASGCVRMVFKLRANYENGGA